MPLTAAQISQAQTANRTLSARLGWRPAVSGRFGSDPGAADLPPWLALFQSWVNEQAQASVLAEDGIFGPQTLEHARYWAQAARDDESSWGSELRTHFRIPGVDGYFPSIVDPAPAPAPAPSPAPSPDPVGPFDPGPLPPAPPEGGGGGAGLALVLLAAAAAYALA